MLFDGRSDIQKWFGDFIPLIERWVSRLDMDSLLSSHKLRSLRPQFKLIDLPPTLKDFYRMYGKEKCSQCKHFRGEYTLAKCLLCGTGLCSSRCLEGSNDIGNLSNHANECHSGRAIFVMLDNTLLVWVDFPRCVAQGYLYIDLFDVHFDVTHRRPYYLYHLDKTLLAKVRESIVRMTITQQVTKLLFEKQRKYMDDYLL
eukprot:TRINITY_DN2695_c0_g1_i2.p1 TRINITY_DN2695_c0_g1~~TRINITY_DN2695_c0_g1_i2.p1  ORF type:complete len:200 (+),score=30.15 TRINITY_DN2695_c0_g1_i2:116-715(+)